MSAEYIMSEGNENVMLCERGIRTFETYTRNTLDLSAISVLQELSHLPVIVDPSHATGKARLVAPMAYAATAAGADGLKGSYNYAGQNTLVDPTSGSNTDLTIGDNWGGSGEFIGKGGFSSVAFTAVPEPTSGLLMLVGLAGLALRRRRA